MTLEQLGHFRYFRLFIARNSCCDVDFRDGGTKGLLAPSMVSNSGSTVEGAQAGEYADMTTSGT